ncbi:MAG: lipoyl(octanoyl) transferase LipB [Candidatus Pelagadaptatus aseana]|uniref:lipoyl(octanoyl) transferase LipB n=1 Tax=Candidatus Pelagadaptatus aseana TaxID=3120508 RepID=UPI0039B1FEBA
MTEPQGSVEVRNLGLQPYEPVWRAMADYTDQRDQDSPDQFWVVQHPRVFTQGQAGKAEHVLMPGDIPVVQVDRGGQVTYHGPGQLVLYPLIDLRRLGIGVRDLITATENAIVACLAELGISAFPKPDAPGVYVDGDKVASLGFRIRKGKSFHGLSINVDMDLEPFQRINPCGYQSLKMVRTADLSEDPRAVAVDAVQEILVPELARELGISGIEEVSNPADVLAPYL